MDIPVIHKGEIVSAPRNRWTVLRTRIGLALLATGVAIGAMILATPDAKADTILTPYEMQVVGSVQSIVCRDLTFRETPNEIRSDLAADVIMVMAMYGLNEYRAGVVVGMAIRFGCPWNSDKVVNLSNQVQA